MMKESMNVSDDNTYLTEDFDSNYYLSNTYKTYEDDALFPVSVFLLDINGLKTINQEQGHNQGNRIIRDIHQHLQLADIEGMTVLHLRGGTFVTFIANVYEEGAQDAALRIKELLKDYGRENGCSVSIGWSSQSSKYASLSDVTNKARQHLNLVKLIEEDSYSNAFIRLISLNLDYKNTREWAHCNHVNQISMMFGKYYGLSKEDMIVLHLASLFHDIGKIAIDTAILDKEGPLSDDEYEQIKTHSEIGYELLSVSPELNDIAKVVKHHHERYDGFGYPDGVTGQNIPLLSRIITITDTYDAMSSDRPYRKAMTIEETMAELSDNSGKQFDPILVKTFIKMMDEEMPLGRELIKKQVISHDMLKACSVMV